MELTVSDWLKVIRPEYLQSFVKNGGATVKFLVLPDGDSPNWAKEAIESSARDDGYLFAFVDAQEIKVNMIEQIFFSVARQIDWISLARGFLYRKLRENGWSVPEPGAALTLSQIASVNERDPHLIRPELNRLLESALYRDYRLSQEFRLAMMRRCQAELDPSLSPVPAEALERWFRGELARITEVKEAQIYQKVSRHTARHMLSSVAYFLHLCGYSGLFLALDIRRCLLKPPRPRNPEDMSYYYSTAGVLDVYEILRELVDQTDDLEYFFAAILTANEFLDESSRRSVCRYDALKMRIWNEVRDENRPNPLGGLIRLEGNFADA